MTSNHQLPDADHDDFGGLHRDIPHLVERRRALRFIGGAGLAGLLVACGSDGGSSAATSTSTSAAGASSTTAATGATTTSIAGTEASAGAEIPDETAGPFPADGTNGPNVLTDGAVVREDLRTSFGDYSGTADGIETTVQLTIVDADTGSPLPGAAMYLWHCDAPGKYSIYEVEDQNYCRGVGVADDAGRVTFTTIFPGCYSGRWPHMHFEVYDDLDAADSGRNATKTSQLALPEADCAAVYADSRYGDSSANLGRLSLDTDGIFRDGWTDQLATVVDNGDTYTATLLVRV